MGLLEFVGIGVLALLLGYIVTKVPGPAEIKSVIITGIAIVLVVILLHALGLFAHDVKIPQVF